MGPSFIIYTRCQLHQHLRVRFSYKRHFGSFFLSMYVPMYVKKSCQNDICTKNARAFNVDEIDPRGRFHQRLCAKQKAPGAQRLAKNLPFNFSNFLPCTLTKFAKPLCWISKLKSVPLLPKLCAGRQICVPFAKCCFTLNAFILFPRKSRSNMLMKSTPDVTFRQFGEI